MKYPDEEFEVDEVGLSNKEITKNFGMEGTTSPQDKINMMLGMEIPNEEAPIKEAQVDNHTLFDKSDKVVNELPVINTQEKINLILDF